MCAVSLTSGLFQVHISPKKGQKQQEPATFPKLQQEQRSKSEPVMTIVEDETTLFGDGLVPNGGDKQSKPYNSPYSTPVNSQKRNIQESPNPATPPSYEPRQRLLQVGRLSPIDPRTHRAKIPTLSRSKSSNSILSDSHEYTGHIPGGTRSLNQEIWYAACTRAGNDIKAARKANQDTFFMEDCLGGNSHMHLFGVFDGHGINGHVCSHFVRDCILKVIGARNKVRVAT